jgi:hypothetical protein
MYQLLQQPPPTKMFHPPPIKLRLVHIFIPHHCSLLTSTTSNSSNIAGASPHGLLPLVGHSLNLYKFQDKVQKLVLSDDTRSVTSICDWYHGIRLALNTSGKINIKVIPMFKTVKRTDHFTTLLLPVDQDNNIHPKASSLKQSVNMYQFFGQVSFASPYNLIQTMFPASSCPETCWLLKNHDDL